MSFSFSCVVRAMKQDRMQALDNLQYVAHALGGEVSGRQVLAPGPGHSPHDRSLAVRPAQTLPIGS